MTLVRWRPRTELARLDDLFDEGFDPFFRFPSLRRRDFLTRAWEPRVDIAETKDEISLSAELPGIDRKEIKVEVKDDVLTISGEKKEENTKEENTKEENGHHWAERRYGAFSRSFTLPETVQADKTKASFKNGVLRIVLPKTEEAKPKEIAIEVEAA